MNIYYIIGSDNEKFNLYEKEYLRALEYAANKLSHVKTTQYRNGLVHTYKAKNKIVHIVKETFRLPKIL